MIKNQNGNVLLYILIAVALMAALAFAISRDGGGQQAGRMDETRADLMATQLIQHVASAEQVVYQMTQWGADYSDLKFDLPGSTDYDTDVTNQVYHPQGGGLQVPTYGDEIFEGGGTRGWRWQNLINVEWSPTTATDLMFIFIDLSEPICAKINEKLLGDNTIPVRSINYNNQFNMLSTPNDDFMASDCAECENVKSMCVENAGARHAFYTIIGSR